MQRDHLSPTHMRIYAVQGQQMPSPADKHELPQSVVPSNQPKYIGAPHQQANLIEPNAMEYPGKPRSKHPHKKPRTERPRAQRLPRPTAAQPSHPGHTKPPLWYPGPVSHGDLSSRHIKIETKHMAKDPVVPRFSPASVLPCLPKNLCPVSGLTGMPRHNTVPCHPGPPRPSPPTCVSEPPRPLSFGGCNQSPVSCVPAPPVLSPVSCSPGPPMLSPVSCVSGPPRLSPVTCAPGLPMLSPVSCVPDLPMLSPVSCVPGPPNISIISDLLGEPKQRPVSGSTGHPRLSPLSSIPGPPRHKPASSPAGQIRPCPLSGLPGTPRLSSGSVPSGWTKNKPMGQQLICLKMQPSCPWGLPDDYNVLDGAQQGHLVTHQEQSVGDAKRPVLHQEQLITHQGHVVAHEGQPLPHHGRQMGSRQPEPHPGVREKQVPDVDGQSRTVYGGNCAANYVTSPLVQNDHPHLSEHNHLQVPVDGTESHAPNLGASALPDDKVSTVHPSTWPALPPVTTRPVTSCVPQLITAPDVPQMSTGPDIQQIATVVDTPQMSKRGVPRLQCQNHKREICVLSTCALSKQNDKAEGPGNHGTISIVTDNVDTASLGEHGNYHSLPPAPYIPESTCATTVQECISLEQYHQSNASRRPTQESLHHTNGQKRLSGNSRTPWQDDHTLDKTYTQNNLAANSVVPPIHAPPSKFARSKFPILRDMPFQSSEPGSVGYNSIKNPIISSNVFPVTGKGEDCSTPGMGAGTADRVPSQGSTHNSTFLKDTLENSDFYNCVLAGILKAALASDWRIELQAGRISGKVCPEKNEVHQ